MFICDSILLAAYPMTVRLIFSENLGHIFGAWLRFWLFGCARQWDHWKGQRRQFNVRWLFWCPYSSSVCVLCVYISSEPLNLNSPRPHQSPAQSICASSSSFIFIYIPNVTRNHIIHFHPRGTLLTFGLDANHQWFAATAQDILITFIHAKQFGDNLTVLQNTYNIGITVNSRCWGRVSKRQTLIGNQQNWWQSGAWLGHSSVKTKIDIQCAYHHPPSMALFVKPPHIDRQIRTVCYFSFCCYMWCQLIATQLIHTFKDNGTWKHVKFELLGRNSDACQPRYCPSPWFERVSCQSSSLQLIYPFIVWRSISMIV